MANKWIGVNAAGSTTARIMPFFSKAFLNPDSYNNAAAAQTLQTLRALREISELR